MSVKSMRAFPSVVIGCVLTWSAALLPAQAQEQVSGGGGTLIMYADHSTGMLSVNGSAYAPYSGGEIAGASTVNVFAAGQNGSLLSLGSLTKTGTGNLSLSGISTYTGSTTISPGFVVNSGATFTSSVSNNLTLSAGSTFAFGGTLSLGTGTFDSGATVVTNLISRVNGQIPISLGANSTLSSTGVLTLTAGSNINSGGTVLSGTNGTLNGGLLTFGNGGTITPTNAFSGTLSLGQGSVLTSISPTVNLDTGGTLSLGGNLNTGGAGTVTISNVNTGGTFLTGGTLVTGATVTATAGTGTVLLGTINGGGLNTSGSTFTVNPVIGTGSISTILLNNTATLNLTTGGIPQAKLITLANSSTLNLKLPANMPLAKMPPIKNGITGSNGTTATFLDGVLTNPSTVSLLYLPAAQNLVSDPLSLNITETPVANDKYVLEMSYNPASVASLANLSRLYLAWLDTSNNTWKNAVDGNSDGGTSAHFVSGAYNSANDFILGDYGVDTADSTVWAVVDHSGEFGVAIAPAVTTSLVPQSIISPTPIQSSILTSQTIPEPSSIGLLLCGAAMFGRRSRKK